MKLALPHAVPPRVPQADNPDGNRVGIRALIPPAILVAVVGWIGIQGDPSFFSPCPLLSLWIYSILDSFPGLDGVEPLLPIVVGIAHGLLFLAWTWPALRWSPAKIPITFLVLLGLLTAANSLYILATLSWTLVPVGLVPVALLARGIARRDGNEPVLLAGYYALVFSWLAFGAISWPPGVWI